MDPSLQELCRLLPGYCLKSKADNTVKQYRYAFNTFCKWCKGFKTHICPLPASEHYVALYIIHLARNNQRSGSIESATHAISWAHTLAGYQDPCNSSLVRSVKEGAIRETSHPVTKKEPVRPEQLSKLVKTFANPQSSLSDVRTVCMCLLGYAGFLRFSELVNIKMSDINFYESYMTLNISKSKTDVYKEGSLLHIARSNSDTCPVAMLERYLKLADLKTSSHEYVFRSMTYCKKSCSYKLRSGNQPLSYTRSREIVLDAFEAIGMDKSKFGLHSLRSGGATSAAASGINDRLFKKHGRWRTDKAKDGYVKENLSEKLFVTKNLGI